ncbi:hypothetical protein ACP70R_003772 [Stipagrostis hirtigluma subsp. patula]
MAVVAASSRRTLVFVVAPLLMALLAASVSAAGRSSLPLAAEQQEVCGPVKECKEDLCTAQCAVTGSNGVGKCKTEGQVPYCCCNRNPSSVGVHQLVN